jgi:hypothetical protein
MTKAQYSMARECLLRVMQDDFDAKNPLWFPESERENSLDGSVNIGENDIYFLAKKELVCFEQYKRQKYLPTFKFDRSISGTNENGKVITLGYGPVEKYGANLPSGKNFKQYFY